MSYGPVWYEWEKRKTSRGFVTDVYWCNPVVYSGVPGLTATKSKRLVASIHYEFVCTNDEHGDHVHVSCIGFIDHVVLKQAIDYAVSPETAPGSTNNVLAEYAEYVRPKS